MNSLFDCWGIRTILASLFLQEFERMDLITTAVTQIAQTGSGGGLPNSTVVGVVVSFLSALLVYSARQVWEKHKLKRALLTEVEQMEGLQECADQMNRINEPPGRPIRPEDVPAGNSIPTVVYEQSAVKIGLLGSFLGNSELENAVQFYSQVLRYKAIINSISGGGSVSDTDQEDLYDSIGGVAERRKRVMECSSFVD
jgi:hypothetical protein